MSGNGVEWSGAARAETLDLSFRQTEKAPE